MNDPHTDVNPSGSAGTQDPPSDLANVDLANELWFAIVQVRARMRAMMGADSILEPLGLTIRSYTVLSLACSGYGPSQRELANFLMLDARQVVYLVDELEQAGLLARKVDPKDRRMNKIEATDEGRRVMGEAVVLMRQREDASLAPLTPSERRVLLELLKRIAF